MDLGYTEQQQLLKDSARDFVEREFSTAKLRELHAAGRCHDRDLWQKMASLGWQGIAVPEAYGGSGQGWVDLLVLVEEMGRGLLPGPFLSTVLCGILIDRYGSADQKQRWLPGIAEGHTVMALALTELRGTYDRAGIQAIAQTTAAGYRLSGTKSFVRDADAADYILVAANVGDASGGLGLFVVDARAAGLSITPLKTIGKDCQCKVELRDVAVAADSLIGTADASWGRLDEIVGMGALLECGYAVGIMGKATEMTIDYAKTRVQFGRPIGSFQAIQHKVADMVTDLDGSRYITYHAAWRLDEGLPAQADIARAKAWVSEAVRRVMREAHQIHAGIAFIIEHDLHLYFNRAKAAELVFGQAEHHLDTVAAAVLD